MTHFKTVPIYNTKQNQTKLGKGNTKASRKRIRSRSWFFTYNNYDKLEVTHLINYFNFVECKYVFQEELGENKTPHLQGCIRFENAKSQLFQDELSKKIHWERCKNWRKAIKYCSKRETRNGEVYHNIKNLKIRKTIKDPMDKLELYEWQVEILNIISKEPDDRKIYWYWNGTGKNGKSVFAKHLVLKHNAIVIGGRKKDIEYAIMTIDEDKDINIIIMDIARSDYNKISYSAIEEIKNGLFFASKYESKMICINTPHIIIFCNFEPDKDELSKDRWVIKKIK